MTRTMRHIVNHLLCVIGLTGLFVAEKQVDADTSPNYRQNVTEFFHQGSHFAANKQYDLALASFLRALPLIDQAHKKAPTAQEKQKWYLSKLSFWYVIGRTYQLSGKHLDAYRYYRQTLHAKPTNQLKQKLMTGLTEIRPHIQVALMIVSQPAGAELRLTDEWGDIAVARTPFLHKVEPGVFTVVLSHRGYRSHTDSLQIKLGKNVQQTYTLQKEAPLLPPKSRHVAAHISKPRNNGLTTTAPTPPRTISAKHIAGYSLLGLTAVATGIGIALMLTGQQNFNQNYGNPNVGSQEARSAQTTQAFGVASLSGAGISAGVAIVLFVLPQTPSGRSPASPTLSVPFLPLPNTARWLP